MTAVQIAFSRGGFALIDEADEALVRQYTWWAITSPSPHRPSTYARGCRPGERKSPLMHKLLTAGLGWQLTDHINGNGLDNRRENLRPATRSQNGANRRKAMATGSRFKGVTPYIGHPGRWLAYINRAGTRRHLGIFNDEAAAARAYDDAARELFGEFAAVNFPRPGERGALEDVGHLTALVLGGAA